MSSKRQTLNFSHYVPNNKVLEKKIPENPRYKHVKPAVNSGKNVRKYIDSLKEQQRNANHRKDEVFRRIKLSAFVRLAVAVATELFSADCLKDENVDKCQGENQKVHIKEESVTTKQIPAQSAFCSVLMGIGELDLKNERQKQHISTLPKPEKKLPYLLLDVRDQDEYLQCHIITARSYPAAMLSRSVGYETRELQLYKNNLGELIVLYDEDEMIAARVAKTLVERGYENVYLLSGGLKLAIEKFPRGLTKGSSPVHMADSRVQNLHTTGTMPNKNASNETFSQEDIETLQQNLDDYLCLYKDMGPGSSYKSQVAYSKHGLSSSASCKRTTEIDCQSAKQDNLASPKSNEPTQMRTSAQSAKSVRLKSGKNPPWK